MRGTDGWVTSVHRWTKFAVAESRREWLAVVQKKTTPAHRPSPLDRFPSDPITDQGHPHSRITFFGGKGGVGKTTCSAAYAYGAAMAGHRTLLVSTDPAHSLGDLLETSVGDEPKQLLPDLWVRELNPEKAAKKYLDEVRSNLRRLASPHLWAEVERQLDIASASPGADETALFDELVRIIIDADGHYDHVVFDTAPTGHTLRLLSLPELLGIWVEGMLMRREKVQQMNRMWNNIVGVREERTDPVYQLLLQRKNRFAQARHILLDAQQTTFFFVINPEQLPIWKRPKRCAYWRSITSRWAGSSSTACCQKKPTARFWHSGGRRKPSI